ncbi:MAG: hypothetical protein AAFY14_15860 [Pseudomonadota bacterium]
MKQILALTLVTFVAGCDAAYAYGLSYDDQTRTASVVKTDGNLTDARGMTLYTFDEDSAGVSNCYDSCAENWPPYLAGREKIVGLTRIDRRDGTQQWAKDGAPLYYWIGDTRPGDTTGDGVRGVWHVAQ